MNSRIVPLVVPAMRDEGMSATPKQPSEWIAIVDDDDGIRRSLARVFRFSGHTARTFASAEEFLSAARCEPPGCLVLDVQLGGMTGFELQDRLVAEGFAPPIIFITALDHITSAELERRAGAHGYLRKPFATGELLDLVRQHVREPADAAW
jgi:FixJ family two-component response regulator